MAHLPVFTRSKNGLLIALLWGIELGVSGGTTRNLGLVLLKVKSPDHTRELYAPFSFERAADQAKHVVELEGDPLHIAARTKTTLEWRTIYIVRDRPATQNSQGLTMISRSLHAPFHIPQSEITRLLQLRSANSCFLDPLHPTDLSWRRYVALKIDMNGRFLDTVRVVIYLGICTKGQQDNPKHWAMIAEYYKRFGAGDPEADSQVEHVCAEHHVDEWPRQVHPLTAYNAARQFRRPTTGEDQLVLEVSFQPYPLGLVPCYEVFPRFKKSQHQVRAGGRAR